MGQHYYEFLSFSDNFIESIKIFDKTKYVCSQGVLSEKIANQISLNFDLSAGAAVMVEVNY